jgi:NADH-quinone oxidoreductase subunit L
MIAALGIGAYVAAAFHLMTHAFFKALLFLGSGSVIHGMEHGVMHTGTHVDPQDMRNMGGLKDKMPVTFWTFLIGGMALSGLPVVTAGFWSKDEILAAAFKGHQEIVFFVLAAAALLTAFYTARQITMTFLGQPRTEVAAHGHESTRTMIIPLIVLAFFAVSIGWVGIPYYFPVLGNFAPNLIEDFIGAMVHAEFHAEDVPVTYVPLIVGTLVSLVGISLGYLVYRGYSAADSPDPVGRRLGALWGWLSNSYGIDGFYHRVFVVPSRWLSEEFTYRWLDKGVIDRVLHGFSAAVLHLGAAVRRWIDLLVVNRLSDLSGRSVRGAGYELRAVQTGRVQQYMLMAMLVVVVFGVAAFFYFMFLA